VPSVADLLRYELGKVFAPDANGDRFGAKPCTAAGWAGLRLS
jgi:hypothetical protein